MSRIILHIGTHKTATTTIQRSLSMQKDLLASTGILYPDYTLIGKPPHSSHVKITNALVDDNEYFSKSEAQNFFSEVCKKSKYFDFTIISAECMYRHVLNGKETRNILDCDKFSYWRARRRFIKLIANIFDAHDVTVCIAFRRQTEYAESLYQEIVKVTRYSNDFENFILESWPHFAYYSQAECWRSCFTDLRITRFDDLVQADNLMKAFGDLIGCNLSVLKTVDPGNVSIGVDATILKRRLNAAGADHRRALRDIRRMLSKLQPVAQNKLKRRSFFNSAADAAAFQTQFDRDNASLRQLIANSEHCPATLFAGGQNPNKIYGDELSANFLNMLLKLCQ